MEGQGGFMAGYYEDNESIGLDPQMADMHVMSLLNADARRTIYKNQPLPGGCGILRNQKPLDAGNPVFKRLCWWAIRDSTRTP